MEHFPGYFSQYFTPEAAAGAQPFDLEAAVSDYRETVNKTLGTTKTN
jgi:[NiFe] hydrogenase diaphorase moiety large subunit